MRVIPLSAALVATLVYVGPVPPASAQSHDPDAKIAGGGTLPAGWHARTDKNKSLADAKIATMGSGIHVTLGPAVILWRGPGFSPGHHPVGATLPPTTKPPPPQADGPFTAR